MSSRINHLPLSALELNFAMVHLHGVLQVWARSPAWTYDDAVREIQKADKLNNLLEPLDMEQGDLVAHLVGLLRRDERGHRRLSRYVAEYQASGKSVPQEAYSRVTGRCEPWTVNDYNEAHKYIRKQVCKQFATIVDNYYYAVVRDEALMVNREIDSHVVDHTFKTIVNVIMTHLTDESLLAMMMRPSGYLKWIIWAYMDTLRYINFHAEGTKKLFGEFNREEANNITFDASNWSFR
jgi:hypothetical protein